MIHKDLSWKVVAAAAKQWWFLLLFLLLQLIPPYTSQGYPLYEWGSVNAYILAHPIKGDFGPLYPLFQIIPLTLFVALFFAGKKVTRLFSAWVALSYFIIAFLQSVSISDRYGLAVCTPNLFTFLILAGLWTWEAASPKNKFDTPGGPIWKYWPIILALLAFWRPANPITLTPDFNLTYLLTSGAGLSFCLSTPLYLAILTLYFPRVNKAVFIATGFVGVMMGLGNMLLEFVIYPAWWWIGVLHLPLLVISLHCVMLSWGEIVGQVRRSAIVIRGGLSE